MNDKTSPPINEASLKQIVTALGRGLQRATAGSAQSLIYLAVAATIIHVAGPQYLKYLGIGPPLSQVVLGLVASPLVNRVIETIGGNLLTTVLEKVSGNTFNDEQILEIIENQLSEEEIRTLFKSVLKESDLLPAKDFYKVTVKQQREHQKQTYLLERILSKLEEEPSLHNVPYQLPNRSFVKQFVGHKEHIEHLETSLFSGCFITIAGIAGVGKSTLLTKVLWQLHDDNSLLERFPDGVIWYDLALQSDMQVATTTIAHFYGLQAANDPNALKTIMSNKKALIVFDNAEYAEDFRFVRSIMRQLCGVVITSRKEFRKADTQILLQPLNQENSVLLLQELLNGSVANESTINELAKELEGLPLAIVLAAKYINHRSITVEAYLHRLRQSLMALELDRNREDSLLFVFRQSVEAISELGQNVLLVSGTYARKPLTHVTFVMTLSIREEPVSEEDILTAIYELMDFGFLRLTKVAVDSGHYLGLYELGHGLIHRYIREHLARQLKDRWNQVLTRTMVVNVDALKAVAESELVGEHFLSDLFPDVLILQENLLAEQRWTDVLGCGEVLIHYSQLVGSSEDRLRIMKNVLRAAENLNHVADQVALCTSIGDLYSALREYRMAEGYLERALQLAKDSNDNRLLTMTFNSLATLKFEQGEFGEAYRILNEAFDIAYEEDDREAQCIAVINLGIAFLHYNRPEEAITRLEAAAAYAEREQLTHLLSEIQKNLADAYVAANNPTKAVVCLERASKYAEQTGQRHLALEAQSNLGILYQSTGDFETAIRWYKSAAILARNLSERETEALNLGNMGLAYDQLDNLTEATKHTEAALQIFEKMNSQHTKTARRQLQALRLKLEK
jgi:tetratricopeptide (TPR) repeat protein